MPSCRPVPRYPTSSRGETIASALNATPGAAIRMTARNACSSWWTSGRFWEAVPSRFHRNGTASSRSTSTPAFASRSIASAIATKTAGFA